MTGRVCEKHQEYAPDGVCRWCAPAPLPPKRQDAMPVAGLRLDPIRFTDYAAMVAAGRISPKEQAILLGADPEE